MAHNINVKIATYNLHGLNQDFPLGDKRNAGSQEVSQWRAAVDYSCVL